MPPGVCGHVRLWRPPRSRPETASPTVVAHWLVPSRSRRCSRRWHHGGPLAVVVRFSARRGAGRCLPSVTNGSHHHHHRDGDGDSHASQVT
eukprot:scaffold5014_cov387-Prasinococcus_capsulatus_cf.AAC.2